MVEKTKKKNEELDRVVYSYTSNPQAFLEEENKVLKQTLEHFKRELQKFHETPLLTAEVKDVLNAEKVFLRLNNGNEFLVNVARNVGKLKSGDTVLVEQKNLTIVKKINSAKKFNVEQFVIVEKPNVKWTDLGGVDENIEEVREVIELPLLKPKMFEKVGIKPPKGLLLHGPPGTGKTMLAKAVATATNSTFIEIVGSELVQKFIGEGAKLVKEVFQLAREKAPAIIFIDEIDALAAKRIEIGTSGEREVQRTFMQLLAELDGFKPLDNIKLIACTNRLDILDPAIIRPGRLDRLIEVDVPDLDGIIKILQIHTRNMKLTKNVNLESIAKEMTGFSGAEIKAVATEAGYFAIRDNRFSIKQNDLKKAVEKVKRKEKEGDQGYMRMFG